VDELADRIDASTEVDGLTDWLVPCPEVGWNPAPLRKDRHMTAPHASDHDHWHDRWVEGRCGFHQDEVNPHLIQHWPALGVAPGGAVLVPLCGKTIDMLHLRSLGHEVVGIEMSPIACEEFFVDNDLSYTREGERWIGDGITLICGDYFAERDLPTFAAVYDRAALIAIPPAWRERYVTTTRRWCSPGARMLLLTLQYPPDEKTGPPFTIPPGTVGELYGADPLEVVGEEDRSGQEGARWGLSYLTQYVLRFTL
jgi:thiopurine S-methyltransferase